MKDPVKAIAFIRDETQTKTAPTEYLKIVYRLTPAETRVALLLGGGHSPRQIAEMIGVTFETVRSQMKSIYAKTNVKRQSALVRLLLAHTL